MRFYRASTPPSLDAWAARLRGDGGMVARRRVRCRGSTAGLRRVIDIVGVLVIAIDNGGQSSQRVCRHAKIIEQVTVARTGHTALTDTAEMDNGRGHHRGKCAA